MTFIEDLAREAREAQTIADTIWQLHENPKVFSRNHKEAKRDLQLFKQGLMVLLHDLKQMNVNNPDEYRLLKGTIDAIEFFMLELQKSGHRGDCVRHYAQLDALANHLEGILAHSHLNGQPRQIMTAATILALKRQTTTKGKGKRVACIIEKKDGNLTSYTVSENQPEEIGCGCAELHALKGILHSGLQEEIKSVYTTDLPCFYSYLHTITESNGTITGQGRKIQGLGEKNIKITLERVSKPSKDREVMTLTVGKNRPIPVMRQTMATIFPGMKDEFPNMDIIFYVIGDSLIAREIHFRKGNHLLTFSGCTVTLILHNVENIIYVMPPLYNSTEFLESCGVTVSQYDDELFRSTLSIMRGARTKKQKEVIYREAIAAISFKYRADVEGFVKDIPGIDLS